MIDPMTDDVMSLADVVDDASFDLETDELAPQTGPLGFDTLDLSEVVVAGALDLNYGVVLVEVADGTLGDTQVLSYTIGTGFDEYVLDGNGDGQVTHEELVASFQRLDIVSNLLGAFDPAGDGQIDIASLTGPAAAVGRSNHASAASAVATSRRL
jgi:hypothetical protein